MEKTPSFQEVCEEIASGSSFDRLSRFQDVETWSSMALEDRERLALLFVRQGEHQLTHGENAVIQTFALASKIAPHSARVWYEQGLVFASQQNNVRCLQLACQALQKATEVAEGRGAEIWYAWANALVRMGVCDNDASCFRQADQRFIAAYTRSHGGSDLGPEFFWHWGVCWYYLGKHSGEAVDFKMAIDKLQQAADRGLNKAVFWNDFGNACIDLGCLVRHHELFYDASQIYRRAVEACEDYFPAWLNLACCYQELFEASRSEDFFTLAEECFQSAVKLNANDVSLWIKWGLLYLNSGKRNHNVKRLEASLEKFKEADVCEPNNSLALERWSEALIEMGAQTDSLKLLREAESKIGKALALAPENSDLWFLYGTCLNQLGSYFEESEHYFNALNKFQCGLLQNCNNAKMYYGMALSCYALGEMGNDPYMVEQALDHFIRHLDLGGGDLPSFWNDWGVALMKQGELYGSKRYFEEALDKFEYAIAVQGGDQDITVLDPELLYNYGCAFDFLGDFNDQPSYYERSIQVLSKVVLLDPDYAHARYNLGLPWLHLGELTNDIECMEKAIGCFEKLIASDPEDEAAWNDWGLTLINMAQLLEDPALAVNSHSLLQEAEDKLLRAVALGSTQAFYNLACLHALKGDHAAAMHFLERSAMAGTIPSATDMLNDEWLDELRNTDHFRSFLRELVHKEQD